MQTITDRYPSDITDPCESCLSGHAYNNGLCRACERAQRNVEEAEEYDAERPEARMTEADVDAFAAEIEREAQHRWRACHMTASGAVVRRCAHCLVARETHADGRVTYVLLSGVRYAYEPVCIPVLPGAIAGVA